MFGQGLKLWSESSGEFLRSLRLSSWNQQTLLEAELIPALEKLTELGAELGRSMAEVAGGRRSAAEVQDEMWQRASAGSRYGELVNTAGRALYGSATFAGETVLFEDRYYKLSFLPPRGPLQADAPALFHAGGTIPYGDGIFRLLPEYNFFDRFLDRGVAVYAMELHGDRHQLDYSGLDIEAHVDSLSRLAAVAYAHNGQRRMMLEGYCGIVTQTLAYLAAKPEEAERYFSTFAAFVGPIDGRRCKSIAEAMQWARSDGVGSPAGEEGTGPGYLDGDLMRIALDRSLRAAFHKSPLGYFCAGWQRTDLNAVRDIEGLSSAQRRDLAGAYWISPDSARRFPVPLGMARYTARLFNRGLDADGELHCSYRGDALNLTALRDRSKLSLMGFYGALDPVVPDNTARCLTEIFGPRYRHVVHADAGHITYVMSRKAWDPDHPRRLEPNPVDLMLAQHRAREGRADSSRAKKTGAKRSAKAGGAKRSSVKTSSAKKVSTKSRSAKKSDAARGRA